MPHEWSLVCGVGTGCVVGVAGAKPMTPCPASLSFATPGPSHGSCFDGETAKRGGFEAGDK